MVMIDDLLRLVPAPAVPVDADGDWRFPEATLGLRLPTDFKALLCHYGIGTFDDIMLWTPFASRGHGVFDLLGRARELVDLHQPLRDEYPEEFPYPLYPEPGGLLEWAGDGDGDSLCWLTEGESDSWPVVVWNIREGAHRYDVGAVELLHGYLSGQREVELLRSPPAVPWFDPYHDRYEVRVQLTEGDRPYAERLRILRDVLAPTADRGEWVGWDGIDRQDHFKAVRRDWLLTYQSAYGHQIRVAFPPEDDDDARAVIFKAAQAMGCTVLGAETIQGRPTWFGNTAVT
jgi:hypothetical protein